MSTKSLYSKNLRKKIWTLRIIDITILTVPLMVFFGMGIARDDVLVVQKVALVGSAAIALMLIIFNFVAKAHLRSAIWIMLLGIYCVIDDLIPLIVSLAVATIIDEFIITPVIKKWHTKYLASTVMDERGIE